VQKNKNLNMDENFIIQLKFAFRIQGGGEKAGGGGGGGGGL